MKFLKALSLLKHREIRASAGTVLASATALPDSGFTFINNSQGASAALNELSGALDIALESFGFADEDENPFKRGLQRLDKIAGEYSNSSSDCFPDLKSWNCSESTAQAVNIAFQCAATVYSPENQPKAEGVSFSKISYTLPSSTGTVKAVGCWKAELVSGKDDEHVPALIIAIKGTERFVDHMVNANGNGRELSDFLDKNELQTFKDGNSDTIYAHSGFLNSAKALLPSIDKQISISTDSNIKHVIFTGHSAGGAVASLLFTKFMLGAPNSHPTLRFSCVTFGSPPVLGPDKTSTLQKLAAVASDKGLFLAFVNEYDLITRADQTYIRSLIDLYRSNNGLPPIMSDRVDRGIGASFDLGRTSSVYSMPALQFPDEDEFRFRGTSGGDDKVWILPITEYYPLGELILLRNEWVHKDEDSREKILRALSITVGDFTKLLYTGIEIHSRRYYGPRIESIAEGKFNDVEGWK